MSEINTGGGAGVTGDAHANQFTGRDAQDHRNYIDIDLSDRRQRSSYSLEDRVMDLERLIYGESKWSEPGLIKRQQRQLQISQINMTLNALMLLLLIAWMIWGR